MKQIAYADLNPVLNTEVNTFTFMDKEIEVRKYLPAEDKYILLTATINGSFTVEGYYNAFMADVLFHLYLIYKYTNLSFTEEEQHNEIVIYDALKSNGFIEKVIETMEDEEYNSLVDSFNEMVADRIEYNKSFSTVVQTLIKDFPKSLEQVSTILKEFDPQKYQNVIDFANAANGNRDIKTNKPTIVATANG